ncbi:MAG: AGE family epimerase/isomerase [bacterium]|nr:AGE family epimerase/isomerase [bacterium]
MNEATVLLQSHLARYESQLDSVFSFWANHGYDSQFGGFMTYLDKEGNHFSTDKSVWALGRGIQTFAWYYQEVKPSIRFLNVALHTFEFMKKYAYDVDHRMYFSLTQEGLPIQKRRYWYSEAFASTGSIQLYSVTKDPRHLALALQSYQTMRDLYYHPEKTPPKFDPSTLQGYSLAPSMILLKTAQTMRLFDTTNQDQYNQDIEFAIERILSKHVVCEKQAVFEYVSTIKPSLTSPRDRLINPGHAIEAAWFLLDEYLYDPQKYAHLLPIVKNMVDWMVELGWDKEHGGLLSFVDYEKKPLEQLEWDMKLWWPQCELLIASLQLFIVTQEDKYLELYLQTFDYFFKHFQIDDLEFVGYLHRDNSVASTLKGNLFKGPFHIPRMLLINYRLLKDYLG